MFCSQLFPLIETSSKFQCPLATCSTFNPSKDNVGISTTRITMARPNLLYQKNTSPCCKTNIYIYIINIPTKKTARTKQSSHNPTNKTKNNFPTPPKKKQIHGDDCLYIENIYKYLPISIYIYRCIVDIFWMEFFHVGTYIDIASHQMSDPFMDTGGLVCFTPPRCIPGLSMVVTQKPPYFVWDVYIVIQHTYIEIWDMKIGWFFGGFFDDYLMVNHYN